MYVYTLFPYLSLLIGSSSYSLHVGAGLSEPVIYMPGSKESVHCDHIGGPFSFTSLPSDLVTLPAII